MVGIVDPGYRHPPVGERAAVRGVVDAVDQLRQRLGGIREAQFQLRVGSSPFVQAAQLPRTQGDEYRHDRDDYQVGDEPPWGSEEAVHGESLSRRRGLLFDWGQLSSPAETSPSLVRGKMGSRMLLKGASSTAPMTTSASSASSARSCTVCARKTVISSATT